MAVRKPGKKIDIWASLRERQEKLDRESPILDTRWFVNETSRRWTNEYDDEQGGVTRRVSKYYETKEGAEGFIQEHDPDDGGTFTIVSENLREYREKRWGA